MNKKNSLLLPPQFFEKDSDEKIRNILDLDVDVLYLFDHFKNPTDSSKPTYKFTEEICNEHNIKLVKFEDGWLCCEYNQYNPKHNLWYIHAREFTLNSFKDWLK